MTDEDVPDERNLTRVIFGPVHIPQDPVDENGLPLTLGDAIIAQQQALLDQLEAAHSFLGEASLGSATHGDVQVALGIAMSALEYAHEIQLDELGEHESTRRDEIRKKLGFASRYLPDGTSATRLRASMLEQLEECERSWCSVAEEKKRIHAQNLAFGIFMHAPREKIARLTELFEAAVIAWPNENTPKWDVVNELLTALGIGCASGNSVRQFWAEWRRERDPVNG